MKKLPLILIIFFLFNIYIPVKADGNAICSFGNSERLYIECSANCDEMTDGPATCVVKGQNVDEGLVNPNDFQDALSEGISESFVRKCNNGSKIILYENSAGFFRSVGVGPSDPEPFAPSNATGQKEYPKLRGSNTCYSDSPNTCLYTSDILQFKCELINGTPTCQVINNNDSYINETFDTSKIITNIDQDKFMVNNELVCPENLYYTQYTNSQNKIVVNKITSCKPERATTMSCQSNCTSMPLTYCSSLDDGDIHIGELDWTTGECSSYLGNPTVKGEPAYYLQFAFDLIKYAAIIILFVFTIVDFVKATAGNQDDMKKATQKAIKRLIIAIIIFFLPILIKFLLTILGAYSPSTCGIK